MLDEVLAALELSESDSGTLRARAQDDLGRDVVFGGEVLGQAIVAAQRSQPSKRVKSVQTIFARGLHTRTPIDISVEPVHEGRNLGSVSVAFAQDGRLGARALVLLDAAEPDLVRHQPPMPDVPPPDAALAVAHPLAAPETIIVGDVDIDDPALTGPPTLQMWVRFPGAPADDPTTSRALLAYATDAWLIATAMRPHEGVGQSMAHKDISTGVVSHALSFHDEVDAANWLLIDLESVFAGGGRCYGRADVFTEAGSLVASFTQEALLRHFPGGIDGRDREKTVF
jgi:acyl-CoA thioesterase